jgi:hypothetical protein
MLSLFLQLNAALSQWLFEHSWLLFLLLVVLLLGLGWLATRWLNQRHSKALLRGFDESTRGRAIVPNAALHGGFVAKLEPPPEPFAGFSVSYRPGPRFDLLARLLHPRTKLVDRLAITAILPQTPRQELQWRRGEIPGRALGKAPSADLWTVHWLDFIQSEYAMRGANPGALAHTFTEMQTRFEPLLDEVALLAETKPQLTVVLRGTGLNPAAIPALVALVRAAGRASLLV